MENITKIKEKFIVIDPKDNVATARTEVNAETLLIADNGNNIKAKDHISFGHKMALKDITKGEPVIKYGQRIGIATQDITVGELVHTHNLSGERGMAR
ncbi:MAG: UxaA family hydrolase [Candidatus Poribacteria bacterium]